MTARLNVKITRRAERQIEAADRWWLENRPSAPGAVAEELGRALQLLSVQPNIGARAGNTRLKDVRRVTLNRIRYYVYYRVREDSLEVLAFWHTSRSAAPRV